MEDKEVQKRLNKLSPFNKCYICGGYMENPQFAHKIANTKSNRAKYGSIVIDHHMNGEMVCSLKCNDKMNIGNKPVKCLKLCKQIYEYELELKQ